MGIANHAAAVGAAADDIAGKAKAAAADLGENLGETGGRIAGKVDDIGESARKAMDDMRRIISDFADRTGQRVDDVADVAKHSSKQAADRFGALVSDIGRDGFESLAGTVAKRPATTLAIAVGVGLLLGLASRSRR